MIKCAYCHGKVEWPVTVREGKSDEQSLICCGDACAERTRAFLRFFERSKALFLIGIGLSMVLILGSSIVLCAAPKMIGGAMMGAGMSLLGLLMLAFPFATPQTFALLGIRKTIILVRLLGVLTILLGPVLYLMMNS